MSTDYITSAFLRALDPDADEQPTPEPAQDGQDRDDDESDPEVTP